MAKPEQLASGTVVWVASEHRYGVVWRALNAGCFLVRLGRKIWPRGDQVLFGFDAWDDDWFEAKSLRAVKCPERIRDGVWKEALLRESQWIRETIGSGSEWPRAGIRRRVKAVSAFCLWT